MFPNLTVELKKNKYSQRGLAKAIGISEKAMSNKMRGAVEFTLKEAFAIKEIFPDCTIEYLFEWCDFKE